MISECWRIARISGAILIKLGRAPTTLRIFMLSLYCHLSQDLTHSAKPSMAKELRQFYGLAGESDIMTKAVMPRHNWAWLIWIKFPGMEVKHHRLLIFFVHSPNPEAKQTFWEQPKVSTPTQREISSDRKSTRLNSSHSSIS